MAVKPLEIHPSALAELRSALTWYLERNETTAVKFAAEYTRAIPPTLIDSLRLVK
jgi:hypothetical protein